MAERRCLSKKIVESDAFYQLPPASQALYVHLVMLADDDGFINGADSVVKMYRNGQLSVSKLLKARFLLRINGIMIVKHWRIMNSLKSDRIKPLQYPEVAKSIWIKENKAYTDHFVEGCQTLFEFKTGFQMDSNRIPNGFPKEQNRKEQKGIEPNRSIPGGVSFLSVWDLYPAERRGDEQIARKAFAKSIRSEADAHTAVTNLAAWTHSQQWTKDAGRYIPFLANWLDRGQWQTAPKPEGSFPPPARRELDADELAYVEEIKREMEGKA